MAKAVVIKAETNEREVVEFDNDTCYSVISGAVGGLVQLVELPELGVDLWVNEEGKINSLPQNVLGTALWVDSWAETDFVAGDCVITGGTDVEGYTLGLSDSKVEELLGWTHGALVSFVGGQVFFETVEV